MLIMTSGSVAVGHRCLAVTQSLPGLRRYTCLYPGFDPTCTTDPTCVRSTQVDYGGRHIRNNRNVDIIHALLSMEI